MTPLEVLGLRPGAGKKEIKSAYRRLALLHHPDRGGDPDAFRRIVAAYHSAMAGDGNRARTPLMEEMLRTAHREADEAARRHRDSMAARAGTFSTHAQAYASAAARLKDGESVEFSWGRDGSRPRVTVFGRGGRPRAFG